MKRELTGLALATALLMTGCAGQGGETLEITENGTYDVSNYSQVVVSVGESTDEAAAAVQDLDLVRVQFKGFSMEVPSAMVEGYTEAELTENDSVHLSRQGLIEGSTETISIYEMDTYGSGGLESFSDAPQEDINGIVMSIKHEHIGDSRRIQVMFMNGDILNTVNLHYPTVLDELYADYSESFYRTIQLA